MSKFNFTVKIPRNEVSEIAIDVRACYGYWDRNDGSEGGGLWFEKVKNKLLLTDYDGASSLPKQVVELLHKHGYIPDDQLDLY